MSGSRYRPKRRMRSEIFPLAVILSLPVAIYLSFPSGAIGFAPKTPAAADVGYSAFVNLDAEREAELLKAARASWQSDSSSRRGIRANLLDCGGSSDGVRIASGIRPLARVAEDPVEEYECDLLPSGVAADAPAMLEAEKASAPEPVFPKSDLLKLN